MHSHATLPLAYPLKNNLFKIYFSTRDEHNRSQGAWIIIDITKPQHILDISSKPFLIPGKLGSFDDSGVMPTCLLKKGNQLWMYYIGWNLGVTVPFRNSIGLAISKDDGKTFQKAFEGPVLDRNAEEPYFIASCEVRHESNLYKIWYLSCVKWAISHQKPKHYYHIKYAESEDGIHWQRKGQIAIDFKNKNEYALSTPRVLKEKGKYKMWYSYRGKHYKIGYAESTDGKKWARKDQEAGITIAQKGWDSTMIEYPFVFDHQGKRYLLYNGNDYGKTGFGLAVWE